MLDEDKRRALARRRGGQRVPGGVRAAGKEGREGGQLPAHSLVFRPEWKNQVTLTK